MIMIDECDFYVVVNNESYLTMMQFVISGDRGFA